MEIPYKSKRYAMYRLNNRLRYLERERPKIYEERGPDGEWRGTSYKKPDEWQLKRLKKKGITIKEVSVDKEIKEVKQEIESYNDLEE